MSNPKFQFSMPNFRTNLRNRYLVSLKQIYTPFLTKERHIPVWSFQKITPPGPEGGGRGAQEYTVVMTGFELITFGLAAFLDF